MTDQLTIVGGSKPADRARQVMDLFKSVGGSMTTNAFAHECINAGLYNDDDRERSFVRFVQGDIRRILKSNDALGLPFAGQTTQVDESGHHVWKQRRMWAFADYEVNISEHLRNRDQNHVAALLLRDECFTRFGEAPEIPPLDGVDATSNQEVA